MAGALKILMMCFPWAGAPGLGGGRRQRAAPVPASPRLLLPLAATLVDVPQLMCRGLHSCLHVRPVRPGGVGGHQGGACCAGAGGRGQGDCRPRPAQAVGAALRALRCTCRGWPQKLWRGQRCGRCAAPHALLVLQLSLHFRAPQARVRVPAMRTPPQSSLLRFAPRARRRWVRAAIVVGGAVMLWVSRLLFARPKPSPLDPMFSKLKQASVWFRAA